MRRPILALTLAGLVSILGACGQSSEEKARDQVCDARADIQKQIQDLQGLTVGTATIDQVRTDLTAIRDDLGEIADARDDLSDDVKQQVDQANQAFRSSLDSALGDLGQGTSLQGAAGKLESAINELADSYRQALAPIDCG